MYIKKVNILFLLILALMLIQSCSLGNVGNNSQGTDSIQNFVDVNKSLGGGYVWGMPYISQSAKEYGQNGSLQADYEKWRDKYVVSTPSGTKRVQRDMNGQYDTVSEGIGYGMLLAVYFKDQDTFDKLFRFAQEHYIFYPVYIPLMHWKVNADCQSVSEFADYNIDPSVITLRSGQTVTSWTAVAPHGAVFGNLTDGTVFITDKYEPDNSPLINFLDNSPNYYRMIQKGAVRDFGSATDADEDMAAALVLSSKVWSSSPNGIDYKSEARRMVKAIQQYDFTSDGFIKGGSSWGDQTCWNPSYFAPGYYLNLYAAICPEDTTFWQKAYTKMYNEMYKIVKYDFSISKSYSKIFFPDWCDTSVAGKVTNGKKSDRIYYKDGQQSDKTASDGMKCPLSAMWKAGTTKDQYTATNLMSLNSYYDAVRVPWRLATDYIWDSKSMWISGGMYDIKYYSGDVLNYVYQSFAAKWGSSYTDLKDGYTMTGDPWKYEDRDGFNVNTGSGAGGLWYVAEFGSMTAPAALRVGGTPPATSAHFDAVVKKDCYGGERGGNYGYNYFGNTLRLLSLVMLTGKFENLYNAPPANGTMVRIYNKKQGGWFMNIEDKVSHTVGCHDGSKDWWSAQWTINRNSDGYYTFKNKWNNGLGYDPYLHCEDGLATAEWDKVTTGGNKGKAPDAGMWSAQWILVQTKDEGYYQFKNRWTGKALTITNMIPIKSGSTTVKVETQTAGWENGYNQWRFEVVQ